MGKIICLLLLIIIEIPSVILLLIVLPRDIKKKRGQVNEQLEDMSEMRNSE